MSATPRPVVNATTVDVAADTETPPGFRTRYRQLGPLLGSELLDATVYEFDPGERNGPYHYEIGNEECLLVLAGTPTLRHPAGREVLEVGAMVVFPDGPDGAHQLINESTTVAGADPVDHAGAVRMRVSGQRQTVDPGRHLPACRDS
ncbi:MAG TPA: cupin domain-containing protein [Solirubrobacteraceae bacterium]|nr:cupin domain-containing protein [Solirubrobacteraceae bacterium]